MLSDLQWGELEPLVEACRPKAKTLPKELRRTISAILWRDQNGAKWRALPEELGPWVASGTDLHPLGTRRDVRTVARSRAGARRRAGHGLPRRQQCEGSPEGGGRGKKGNLQPSEMLVKHLAALVAAMAPRPT
jgi:hypothetical protein